MTDDRQQHIDTLARLIKSGHYIPGEEAQRQMLARDDARRLFDSTDPAVHDALVAALHANADRARVLAAHADAGWLDEERQVFQVRAATAGGRYDTQRRLVTPWEPTP